MTITTTNRITLWLTAQELERMTYAANLSGKSLQQFILDAALKYSEQILTVTQATSRANKSRK